MDVIWATPASSTCGAGGAAGAGAGAARKASRVRGFFGGGRRAGALRRDLRQSASCRSMSARTAGGSSESVAGSTSAPSMPLDAPGDAGDAGAGCVDRGGGGLTGLNLTSAKVFCAAGAAGCGRGGLAGFILTSFSVVWPLASGTYWPSKSDDRTPISLISNGVPAASASPMASRSRGFNSLTMDFHRTRTYLGLARFLSSACRAY